jgi:hypothetical protein
MGRRSGVFGPAAQQWSVPDCDFAGRFQMLKGPATVGTIYNMGFCALQHNFAMHKEIGLLVGSLCSIHWLSLGFACVFGGLGGLLAEFLGLVGECLDLRSYVVRL